jgi:hypothetical protein
MKKKGVLGKVGAFIAGASAATVVGGYFLYGPKGKENRKKVEGWVVKAKGEVLEKIENTKEMSEEKYAQIIDTVTAKYGKAKHIGRDRAAKLGTELKHHWKEVKKEVKEEQQKKQK